MTTPCARVVELADVAPIELRHDSWSRVLISDRTVDGNETCLGYSVFGPGLVTADLSHSVDELCFVVSGGGKIRLETEEVEVRPQSALFIPARVWHTVVNDRDEDLVMVFCFPYRDYPPTERQESRP